MHRLADQSSRYLRQHASNPVDWHPWDAEALALARATDRPLFVSIGYSSCHWCHVMAHESFEDPEIADLVNAWFVPIKVDREERPDLDAIYLEATQAMTGSGGWPLTVFCTPDGEPFYCGTYFPKVASQGRPSFRQLCEAVEEAWRTQREDILDQAAALTEHLRTSSLPPGGAPPDQGTLARARAALLAVHDRELGGFGSAPKFPQTLSLEVLLRAHLRARSAGDGEAEGDPEALAAVVRSLDAMAAGGIQDHVGGGFARYATDRSWLVPHFEKMLVDQALIARTYLRAWQATGHARFLHTAEATIDYVLDRLAHPAGGWFTAEDADSDDGEGRYYLWTPDELRAVLGPDAEEAMAWWGVGPEPTFEGAWILNRLHGDPSEPEPATITVARALLRTARDDRTRPGLDDKVLCEWNALFLATLAEAAAATGNRVWLEAAIRNGEFLLRELRDPLGRWYRSWQDDGRGGRSRHLALAADHAALVDGFTRLAEATGEARWITEATRATDELLTLFWDDDEGGLFTTSHDAEPLVARVKDQLDSAIPSANSSAAVALLRLAALTGSTSAADRATEIVALAGETAADHPAAFAHLLAAVDLLVHGIEEIVVAGDRPDLLAVVRSAHRPGAVLAWGERYPSPLWEGREDGYAYVCRDFACQAPTADPEALAAQLG